MRDVGIVKSALSANGQTASLIISGIGEHSPYLIPSPLIFLEPVLTPSAQEYNLGYCNHLRRSHYLHPQRTRRSQTNTETSFRCHLDQRHHGWAARHAPSAGRALKIKSHQDKTNIEQILANSVAEGASGREEAWIRGFVAVRPSLLTNRPAKCEPKLRIGVMLKPAVGYTVSREVVGKWIFDELLANEGKDRWVGKKVSLTYQIRPFVFSGCRASADS